MHYLLGERWAADLHNFHRRRRRRRRFPNNDEMTFFDIVRSICSYSLRYSGLRPLANTFVLFVVLYLISTQIPIGFERVRSWAKLEIIFICCAFFIPVFSSLFLEHYIPFDYVDIAIETITWLVRVHFYATHATEDAKLFFEHKQEIANLLKEIYFPHLCVLEFYIYFFH